MDTIVTEPKEQNAQDESFQSFDGIFITTKRVMSLAQVDRKGIAASDAPTTEVTVDLQEEEELNPQIESFKDDIQYYLCCCGYFIGFGNVLVFPHLIFDNGGAAFLIPYTLAQVFIVLPCFVLETAWGQLIRSKLHHKFSMVNPQLSGVALAMAIVTWQTTLYYVVLFPWSLNFFWDSFSNPLPWKSTDGLWNTNYFKDEVLHREEDPEAPLRMVPKLFICLVASYILIYFTVWKGLSTSSQIVYFTVPVPCFIMAILLIKGATLKGSELGLYYLFVPEWDRLLEFKIWEKALTQSMFQTGIVYGPMMLYATARKPNAKIVVSSIVLPFIDYFLSILGAIALFAFLGHVASEEGIEVQDLTKGGLDLAFIAYPGLMTTLTLSNFWSILFFLMLLLIGVDTIIGMFDFVTAFCWDFFELRGRVKKQWVVLAITLVLFIVNAFLVTNKGWNNYVFLSKHVGGFSVIVVLLLECYTIAYAFGFDKLDALMKFQTGETIPKPFKLFLKFFAMPSMTVILISSIYREFAQHKEESAFMVYFGRVILALPIAGSLIGFCLKKKSPTVEALVEKQYGKTLDELVAIHLGESEK